MGISETLMMVVRTELINNPAAVMATRLSKQLVNGVMDEAFGSVRG